MELAGREEKSPASWGQVSPADSVVRYRAENVQANSLAGVECEETGREGRTVRGEIATVQAGHQRG